MQNRHSWLQRAHQSNVRNHCRITHKAHFPDNLHGLYSTRFSANGEMVVVGFGSGGVQIRNGTTGELKATLKSGLETSMPIMCCRFNPVRRDVFYASSACGTIFMCDTRTKEFSRFIFEPDNEVNTIDVSITGDYLVSGGKDAVVRLYDIESTKLILMYKKDEESLMENRVNFHRMRIFASRFHDVYPDLIITGGWDDTVRIWDIRVPSGSARVIKGPHICGDAIDIRETHILTGSWVVRDSLQLWDLTSAKLIDTINPQNRSSTLNGEFLYVAHYFNGDPSSDLVVIGGSGTGMVEVISLKQKKVMGSFNVSKPIFTIDSCRSVIVFGGMESAITFGDYS
ncbi:hypothetical protein DMN91_002830 [Ooceraea biroi]|uniref:WD repeat-containing protein n=1 Tax=Ooceraea biroi TaxID=2015173 RepID=A0A026WP81_OOCBI|nr:WD repeat-containing protein 38 [Ooceraea biroi]EZA57768.1 WD repeat-containing protein [Ooceraea biroi]RLU24740.1 hypothetical protein DMN91_002830 [Ooceraea biroi]